MDSRLRSLGSLLGKPGSQLQRLVARAAARRELCRRVRTHLPAELAGHLVDVELGRDGTAVVTLDSPAWASRLRYDDQAVKAAFRAAALEVRAVRVRVAPPGSGATTR